MHISTETAFARAHTHTHTLQSQDQWWSRYLVRCPPLCLHKQAPANSYRKTTSLSWARSHVSSCIHWHPYIVLVLPCRAPKGMLKWFISPAHASACMDSRPTMRETHTYGNDPLCIVHKGSQEKSKSKVPYIKSLKTYVLCYSSEHEYYLHMVYYKHLENSIDSK